MKKMKLCVCLMLIISLLSSCITYNLYDENGNLVYKDYYRAIQFSYPADWKTETRKNDTSLYVIPNEYDGEMMPEIRLSVVYHEQQPEQNGDMSFIEEYVNDIKNTYLDVEIIDYGTKENSAGDSTDFVKYKYTDSSGKRFYASDRINNVSVLNLLGIARCSADEGELYDEKFDITLDTLTVFS